MIITAGVKIGIGKDNCDDIALANDLVINNANYLCESELLHVVGITDGVGGNAGGKEASFFVASELSPLSFSGGEAGIRDQLFSLNNALINYAVGIPEKSLMATTLTAVIFSEGQYYLAHIGNTRLYVGRGSYLKQMTEDHTTYQWLLTMGRAEEAEQCNKNEISACLGNGDETLAKQLVVRRVFEDGLPDVLIFTSDGIHEYIDIDHLEDLIFSGNKDSDIIHKAISEAEANGSLDDKTIVIVRNNETGEKDE